MLNKGPAQKVTIYLNEDTRHHFGPLYEAILTFLMHKGIAGATATRAMAGFGPHRVVHTTKIEVLTQHLPIRIEFIDTPEKVDSVLPDLYEMVTDGLIEVEETTIVKVASSEQPEAPAPREKRTAPGKLMRIFMGEGDRWNGEPLYDAIVKRLRMMDVSGATVHRGILGYGLKGEDHKAGFLHLSGEPPVMVSVVDTPEKIEEAMGAIESMMQGGLIVISDVEVTRLSRKHLTESPDADRKS
jgi:PII-like signaling protein